MKGIRTKLVVGAGAAFAVAGGGAAYAAQGPPAGKSVPMVDAASGALGLPATHRPPLRLAGGHGKGGHGDGGHVRVLGHGLDAAAAYLGLGDDELRERLRAGTSLADVARAEARPVAGLVEVLVAAETAALGDAVAAGAITDAQRDRMLEGIEERIGERVNATFGERRTHGGEPHLGPAPHAAPPPHGGLDAA